MNKRAPGQELQATQETSQCVGTAREVRPKAGWVLTELKDGVATTVAQDDIRRAGGAATAGPHKPTGADTCPHAAGK